MTAELKKDGTLELEIRREFSFPRELVFDAWVKPEHLYKWMGPTDEIKMENIEVGPSRIYSLRPEGFAQLKVFLEDFWDPRLAKLKAAAEKDEKQRRRKK